VCVEIAILSIILASSTAGALVVNEFTDDTERGFVDEDDDAVVDGIVDGIFDDNVDVVLAVKGVVVVLQCAMVD